MRILVLGAGPTGLGAAYRLEHHAVDDWIMIEASDHPGGLASSFRDDHGFTWDIGGHVEFSHYDEYDRMADRFLGTDRVWHERRSWIKLKNRRIPYPFQSNLHRLSPEERQRALTGLAEALATPRGKPAANFREWVDQTFGTTIAALFMVPYNEKVWGYPLEMLDHAWITERVAVPDPRRAWTNIDADLDQTDWGPNRTFWYPLHGGTGETWNRLARGLPEQRIMFNTAARQIDLLGHSLTLSNGRTLQWDALATTLPLDVFCGLCGGLSSEVTAAAQAMRFSACHIVGLGLRGPIPDFLRMTTWMYFPGSDSPYYRVSVLSNYSPNNAPPGCWSLLAEISETSFRPVATKTLMADVVAALERDGLIPEGTEIISRWSHHAERGYPTPFLGRDSVLSLVLAALESHGVYSRGRFGAWKYEVSNQDHCFMQGVELIDRLLGLGQEITVFSPEKVNRRAHHRKQPR
jgi:protoporphyrinogen oxidase